MSVPSARDDVLPSPLGPDPSVDETTERILDAAYERLLRFGLRRTTIEDIARGASIARPTLYRRFPDKDAIVRAVIVRETRRALATVTQKLACIADSDERIVRGFVLVTKTAACHPLIRRLLDTEPEAVLPHLSLHSGYVIDLAQRRFTPFFKALQQDGEFTGIEAAYAIETMVRLFLSIVLTPSKLVAPDDDVQLERLASHVILPLLRGGSARVG